MFLHEASSQIPHVKCLYRHPDCPGLSLVDQILGIDALPPPLPTLAITQSTTSQFRAFAELCPLFGGSSCSFLQPATPFSFFKSLFKTAPLWKDRGTARDFILSPTSPARHVLGQMSLLCDPWYSVVTWLNTAFTMFYHSLVFLNTGSGASVPLLKSGLLCLPAGSASSFVQWTYYYKSTSRDEDSIGQYVYSLQQQILNEWELLIAITCTCLSPLISWFVYLFIFSGQDVSVIVQPSPLTYCLASSKCDIHHS